MTCVCVRVHAQKSEQAFVLASEASSTSHQRL